jgi:hypothetical protein
VICWPGMIALELNFGASRALAMLKNKHVEMPA